MGATDEKSFRAALEASSSADDFERSSEFMRLMQIDHGAWKPRTEI